MSGRGLETLVTVDAAFLQGWREAFCKMGPRHRMVDRWTHDLGWTIDKRALEAFLAPELPANVTYFGGGNG